MKVAVVYWSQTGNTQAMAEMLAKAADADLFDYADFSAADVANYDALAFGCPAMGSEELDPDFEELWDACVDQLGNKSVGLFGSYDWGTGEWMETWEEQAKEAGVNVVGTVIANLEPDAEAESELEDLAKKLVA